jgi:hypothetical protein
MGLPTVKGPQAAVVLGKAGREGLRGSGNTEDLVPYQEHTLHALMRRYPNGPSNREGGKAPYLAAG